MCEQRVNQGAVGIAWSGMNDKPGRLVYDNDMGVLEADVESHGLCRRACLLDIRKEHDEILARLYAARRVAGCDAVMHNVTVLDQPLQPGSRVFRKMVCQHAVKARAIFRRFGLDLSRAAGTRVRYRHLPNPGASLCAR